MFKRLICFILVATLLTESSISILYALDEHMAIQKSNAMWQQILDTDLSGEPSDIVEEPIYEPVDSQSYINNSDAAIAKSIDIEAYEREENELDEEYLSDRFIISYRLLDEDSSYVFILDKPRSIWNTASKSIS